MITEISIFGPDGWRIAGARSDLAIASEAEANAKLIASAPCLLETLQDVLSYLDLKAEQFAMDYPPEHAIRLSCDRHRDSIRSAIAKATN